MSQGYTSDISAMIKDQEKVPGFKEATVELAQKMAEAKDSDEVIASINNNWKELASKEKKEFVEDNKTEITPDDLTMFPKPRKGCKKCYGRGFDGWELTKNQVSFCRCIMNRVGKVFDEDALMSYGEMLKMIEHAKEVHNIKDKEDDIKEDV